MRICYLADGRYIHAHRWLRYFSRRGHEMHLLSFAPMGPEHVAAVGEAGASYQGQLEPFHLKKFWRTGGAVLALRRFLRRERIDVLHCHFLGINAWYAALSRFHPFVLTVMGGDVCGPEWRPGSEVRERFLTPLALRKADLITCWSHRLTGVVKDYSRPGVRVEVIHGGVDLARFTPGPKPVYLRERWSLPPTAKVILSPRLMRSLYNLDRVAEAANEVCAADPEAYFLFAFLPEAKDDEYEARVRSIIASGPAAERTRFIGGIPHDEMADHYRLADVTVSVPLTDGTPMSVLESMACSTPVVVSDIPDYDPHYIEREETVLMAKVDEAGALSSALLRLLREPGLATKLAAEARRRVESDAGYDAQMARMESLYEELRSDER